MPTDNPFRQVVVVLGLILFLNGYLLSKLVALVSLASGMSFLMVVGWCSVEAVVLLVVRYIAEGFRYPYFHLAGVDGFVQLLATHGIIYTGMLAAPFPLLRCTHASARHRTIHLLSCTPHRGMTETLTNESQLTST